MATTTLLITSNDILENITIEQTIDPFFFEREILYCQEVYLKSVLTEELYYELLDAYEDNDLSAELQLLYDRYVKFIVVYGTAYRSLVGNVKTQASNQGVEINRTEYSNSAPSEDKRFVANLYVKCFHYQKELGRFLLKNQSLYPNFQASEIVLNPEFFYLNF